MMGLFQRCRYEGRCRGRKCPEDEMQNNVEKWISSNNGEYLSATRQQYFSLIRSMVRSEVRMYSKAIRQTLSEMNSDSIHRQRNAWGLLRRLSSETHNDNTAMDGNQDAFDEVMQQQAIKVTNDGPGDPVVRWRAREVLQILPASLFHPNIFLSNSLSPALFQIEVQIGEHGKMLIYDTETRVGDGILQLAWTMGLEALQGFRLYAFQNNAHKLLDNASRLFVILNSNSDFRRLVMKREIFGVLDTTIQDPVYWELSISSLVE